MNKLFLIENLGFLGKLFNKLYSLSLERLIILTLGNILFFCVIFLTISYLPNENSLISSSSLFDRVISSFYYSSSLASNTGVGDLGTINIFKILGSIEMIISIFLFAFVIAKLTSKKSEEVMKNLFEMEIETNYRNLMEELFKIRKRLDAVLKRSLENKAIDDDDLVVLSVSFMELSSVFIIAPKLLLNIGDNSQLDRNRQEVMVAMIKRTLARTQKTLVHLNIEKIFWANQRNILKLTDCIKLHRKYHESIVKNKKSFTPYLLQEIKDSKVYSEYLEKVIQDSEI